MSEDWSLQQLQEYRRVQRGGSMNLSEIAAEAERWREPLFTQFGVALTHESPSPSLLRVHMKLGRLEGIVDFEDAASALERREWAEQRVREYFEATCLQVLRLQLRTQSGLYPDEEKT